jgi:DNA topoisomerase VI subunit B
MGIVNNFRRGMTDIEQGHTERGIEAMLPAAIRNAMKSIRFGIEGATTKEGVKLTDDPNGYELVMQFLGFTPKDLGDRYAANEIMKKAQRNGLERRTALLARLNLAKQEGDLDEILEIRQKIQSFNTRGPGASIVKPIKADTISKSEKQFHVKQRQMAQTGGVYLGKPMSREVRNLRALVPDEDED